MATAGGRGGVYIPPHRLKAMQAAEADKASPDAQRSAWEQLRKGINGVVNKVNGTNIVHIIPELFRNNLVRGRGLVCRAVQKAQMSSPGFTHVYAALVAVVNTKLPEIGELLLKRLVVSFKRAYKRNNKIVAVAAAKFIAHLVNQKVAHEIVALQLLALLLERPTDDAVEVAVTFTKECGACLSGLSPAGLNAVFERFRGILQDGSSSSSAAPAGTGTGMGGGTGPGSGASQGGSEGLDKRTQYLIEGLFLVRRAKFADFPSVPPDLDLVEEEEQITHDVSLDEESVDVEVSQQESLDVFKLDPQYADNEAQWEAIRKEIIGEDEEEAGPGQAGGAAAVAAGLWAEGGGGLEDDMAREGDDGAAVVEAEDAVPSTGVGLPSSSMGAGGGGGGVTVGPGNGGGAGSGPGGGTGGGTGTGDILDMSEADLVHLRRSIYLTIMSSLSHEEAGHKLLKMSIPRGAEGELASMLVECCSQERSFLKYYSLTAARFCMLNRQYQEAFDAAFAQQFAGCHRLETGRLRNVAKFFAHLLAVDALPWTVLEYIRLTEESTNPSSRIFLKVLFQELAEYMGMSRLKERLCDPDMSDVFAGLLPMGQQGGGGPEGGGGDLRDTRFSINFFTSIGLGALTDDMRAYLKEQSARNAAIVAAAAAGEL